MGSLKAGEGKNLISKWYSSSEYFLLPSVYENGYHGIFIVNNSMSWFIYTVLANSVKALFSQIRFICFCEGLNYTLGT